MDTSEFAELLRTVQRSIDKLEATTAALHDYLVMCENSRRTPFIATGVDLTLMGRDFVGISRTYGPHAKPEDVER